MMFEGVRPVLHTPFEDRAGEPVHRAALHRLVDDQVAAGVAGVVALGLASEARALIERERDAVLALVAEALDGRLPLVVGIDGTTADATDRARRAAVEGAAGLMVLPPPSPDRSSLPAHFAAVADASGLPVLVQDAPQATGVDMSIDDLLVLRSAHPLVAAVKIEAPGAGAKGSAAVDAGFEVVAGWGGLHYLDSVRRGAVGCMPGCDLGPAFVEIDGLARSGDGPAAERAYRRILPLLSWETQSLDLLLLGAKRVLVRRGIFESERLRFPGRALDPIEAGTLDSLIDELVAADVPGFRTAVVAGGAVR